jgi:O-antigen/teichoic acid export membrane protein
MIDVARFKTGGPMTGTPIGFDRRSAVALVPGALVVANLFSYLLLVVAARLLDREDYGELLSLLGVLLVATVPSLAMQTISARRTAVAATTSGSDAGLVNGTIAVSGVSTAVLLLVTPALSAFLHLGSPWGLLAVDVSVPALTALGTLQGVAQGARRFAALAVLTMATVGGRAIGGLVGLLIGRSSTWCLIGAAVGASLAAAGALLAELPRLRQAKGRTGPLRDTLVEALHAAHGHGAFLLVTSLDVLLARHVLSSDGAGIYAAGSVVTRAALWLPQSVAVLMFATFADHSRHRRAYARSVAGVAVIGAATVLGVAGLGRLTVSIVAGAKFHRLDSSIWIFALVGAALAVLQLSIVAGLALRRPGRIAIIWAVAVADVALVLSSRPHAASDVAAILALISVLGAAASVALALLPRGDRTADVELVQPVDFAGQEPEM